MIKIKKSEFIFRKNLFRECHASTIEATPNGLVVAWFAGTKEGNKDTKIWLSRLEAGKWTKPTSVANGIYKDKRYAVWNPVLFLVPQGTLLLFYKVGFNPKKWWGEVKYSNNFGKTWSENHYLSEDIFGPTKNKPILTEDERLICPSSTENKGWRIHFEISKDLGNSWKKIGPINDAKKYNVIQPSILKHGKDILQAVARSKESKIISSWSYDGGYTWSKLQPIELPNPNSAVDALTLENGLFLLVYNHSQSEEGEWGKGEGGVWGGPRTPLNIAVSNNGKNWKRIITLEDDVGEYSYPAVIQSLDGLVHITYTWKRQTIKHTVLEPELFNENRKMLKYN